MLPPLHRSLILSGALCVACGADFFDPAPPVLTRVSRSYAVPLRIEPVAVGIISDLHAADAAGCLEAVWQIETAIREVLVEAALPHFILPTVFTSANCQQHPNRHVDLTEIDTEVRGIAEQFPEARIRPVLLYLNNADLPMPPQIRQVLEAWKPTGRMPLLYGAILHKESMHLLRRWALWTFLDDPTLPGAIAELFRGGDIPLWSTASEDTPVELLTPEERAAAVGVKICAAPGYLRFQGVQPDGSASLSESPEISALVQTEGLYAESAEVPRPEDFTVDFELCVANCDRLVHFPDVGGPRRWDREAGCALKEADGAVQE